MKNQLYYFLETNLPEAPDRAWGEKLSRLWDYGLSRATTIQFALGFTVTARAARAVTAQYPHPTPDGGYWPRELRPLQPDLVYRFTSRWQYGFRQRFTTTFVHYACSPAAIAFLRARRWLEDEDDYRVPNEYWVEDPALYQADTAVVYTVSHEGYAFVLLTEAEAQIWRQTGWRFEKKFDPNPPTRPNEG